MCSPGTQNCISIPFVVAIATFSFVGIAREREKEREREMSNAKTARFGPAANWEGYRRQPNYTEAMKEGMDCRPVSGHYADGDGRSWSWHQTYESGAGGGLPKPVVVAIRALRSFVGVGAVAACKVAAEDAVDCLSEGGVSRHQPGRSSLKKICREGAAAGAFETLEFGAELMRGRSDWKNAVIGGALAGAAVSVADGYYNRSHGGNAGTPQVIKAAVAGGAIGAALELISHRRHVDRLRTDGQTMELTHEPNPLTSGRK
ncbi:uncharacterized protein [Zea mays]|uniref:Uncharacterized protein n=1 Tax=Zea mays TaxID=4577 RepID=A0A804PRM0_MAIZE|nr:uncharacterized protein LOC103629252 isoform X2 [Zea mays]|eukprot:XP_008648644.1 uncharacterized protein LOC103629252 isoform X2 [Zea mays]